MDEIEIVLLHGNWYREWCWKYLKKYLRPAGFHVRTVSFPYYNKDSKEEITLESFIECAYKVILKCKAKPIILAHSMSGVVLSELCERYPEKIRAAIYLTAFLLDDGQSVHSFISQRNSSEFGAPKKYVDFKVNGRNFKVITLEEERIKERFYQDCDPSILSFALPKIKPVPFTPQITPIRISRNFRKVDKYYITCLNDKAVTPEEQRKMYEQFIPKDKVYTLNSSHSPFFSMPEQLKETILAISKKVPSEESKSEHRFHEIQRIIKSLFNVVQERTPTYARSQ